MSVATSPAVLADIIPFHSRTASRASYFARQALLVMVGVAVVTLAAQVRIPLQPVPITLQTLAVVLVAATLGTRRGTAALAVYLAVGAAGLPVFSGWQGGLPLATAGFIVGFIPAAWVVGKLAERSWDRNWKSVAVFALGLAIPFLPGLAWLGWVLASAGSTTAGAVLSAGLIPFIPGELIKLVAAALIMPTLWATVGRAAR